MGGEERRCSKNRRRRRKRMKERGKAEREYELMQEFDVRREGGRVTREV